MRTITHVLFILDSSGSMDFIRREAIGHFNEHLQQIREASRGQEVKVGMVTFNNPQKDKVVHWDSDIATIPELSHKDYIPTGVTALYDAIGIHVGEFKRQVESLMAKDLVEAGEHGTEATNRAGMVVIVTDGFENASKEYKSDQVKQLMKSLEDSPKWTVVYLGANHDIFGAANGLGIRVSSAHGYVTSAEGLRAAAGQTQSAYSSYFDSRMRGATSKNFWGTPDKEDSSVKANKSAGRSTEGKDA